MKSGFWSVLDTGIHTAKENMSIDVELLEKLANHPTPILHLYDWKFPSATYGLFIDSSKYLTPETFNCLELAKRPTGGGVIFHLTDFAFSLLVPSSYPAYSVNTLDNYAFVNQLLIEVISQFSGCKATLGLLMNESQAADPSSGHFCMANPTKFDVMIAGKKVGGGAQRRTKSGFLHQGTVSLALPKTEFLQKILLPGTYVFQSMQQNTYALLEGIPTDKQIANARHHLKETFINFVKSIE